MAEKTCRFLTDNGRCSAHLDRVPSFASSGYAPKSLDLVGLGVKNKGESFRRCTAADDVSQSRCDGNPDGGGKNPAVKFIRGLGKGR